VIFHLRAYLVVMLSAVWREMRPAVPDVSGRRAISSANRDWQMEGERDVVREWI
jgi:hypothetical protein